MCVVCYTPAMAIGEIALVGGPFVAAAVIKVRRALGYEDIGEDGGADAPRVSAPPRIQSRPAPAAAAPAAAASSPIG